MTRPVTRKVRRGRGLRWSGWIGAAAALGALGLQAGPVGGPGQIRGIELVQWTSRSGPEKFKRAFAKCPDGKTVIGGGGRVFEATPIDDGEPRARRTSPRLDDIGLSVSVPSLDMDGWAVTAQAMHPRAKKTDWFVSASAVCAETTGVEPVQWSTKTDATTFKRAFARCPAGLKVIGGGGRVFVPSAVGRLVQPAVARFPRNPLPDHPIALALSAPSADGDGWAVTARTMRPKDRQTPWFATASAVCAEVSDLELVDWSSVADTSDFKRAFAKCPDGSVVVAGGGRVFAAPSNDPAARRQGIVPSDDEISLTVSVPSASLDGWAVTAQAMHGRTRKTNWFVTASAVCVQVQAQVQAN
jgi:hypothetical protein